MSVRLRDVAQPGMRHRRNPGCSVVTIAATMLVAALLRRKR